MHETSIEQLLKHCNTAELKDFVLAYCNKNYEFRKAFDDRFNPVKKISGDKGIYDNEISRVFLSNPGSPGSRYRGWEDYGFCAEDVAEDLQLMLDKAKYFLEAGNSDEAILICQSMIETIPIEWDANFDYDGDVQVKYDAAIDLMQEMLEQEKLSLSQKEHLFQWFQSESKNSKHEHVGLNTDLRILEKYFSDTPEMIRQILTGMDQEVKCATSDYDKKKALLRKIEFLRRVGQNKEAEALIDEHIHLGEIRELRLESLMQQKEFEKAIDLIREGIEVERKKDHSGNVTPWKEKLFNIYKLMENFEQALPLAEDLICRRRNAQENYRYLKEHTSYDNWPETLSRLLARMNDNNWGFNELRAEILIEHRMWDELLAQCQKSGTKYLEHFEKYLKPVYPNELFVSFQKYVEQRAVITDQDAYIDVARVLKKMKKYEGGSVIVDGMVRHYREIYKRRKNMMKELEGV